MKAILLSAALALSTTATQAADVLEIDTELKMNGRSVSASSSQVIASIGIGSNKNQDTIETLPVKLSLHRSAEECKSSLEVLLHHLKLIDGGKIQLAYVADYTGEICRQPTREGDKPTLEGIQRIVSKSDVGTRVLDIPQTVASRDVATLVLTSGKPISIHGGSKTDPWEISVTATASKIESLASRQD